MTEELRLILLGFGVAIIGYIIWDARRKKNVKKDKSQHIYLESHEEKNTVFQAPESSTDITGLQQTAENTGIRLEPDISDDFIKPEALQTHDKDHSHFVDEDIAEAETNEKILVSESDPGIVEKIPQPGFFSILKNSKSSPIDIADKPTKVLNIHKPETVITINVMANVDADFNGEKLLQELLTLGFKFGEMNIFHRNHHANGQGERWFSLANAFNPGEFNLEKMAEFSTLGLTIFMLLPGPQQPQMAFEYMLKAAEKLADVFDAHLEDGSHSVLTRQRIAMYREEINHY